MYTVHPYHGSSIVVSYIHLLFVVRCLVRKYQYYSLVPRLPCSGTWRLKLEVSVSYVHLLFMVRHFVKKVWINKSLASFSGSSCWLLAFVFTVSNQNWRQRMPGNKANDTSCFTLAFLNSHDATSSCYSYVNTLTEWHCPPSLVVSTISLIFTGLASSSGRSLWMRLPWSLNASCVEWGNTNTGWHINAHHVKKLCTHEVWS